MISVILCTYNRCEILPKTLDSIAASTLPDSTEWEVLVVDNNSKDRTRSVMEEYCKRYPGLRYVFEPQPGKSHALNTGIREAKGEILAFTDDDVIVEPTWLQNLTAALHDGQWAGAGGRIELQWPSSVPNWLAKSGPYARHGFPGFEQGPDAGELRNPPFGANMAFRRAVFQKHGNFRTDLGRNPSNEIRSEDLELGRRLMSAGLRLRYAPSAVVYHPVRKTEIDKKHLLQRRVDRGRADAREFHMKATRVVPSLAAWTVRWMTSAKPSVRFYSKAIVLEKIGTLEELHSQSQEEKKKRAQKAEAIKRDLETMKQDRLGLLRLKAGEWVEIRSKEEILATLDERGCLGNLPFMPEMLQHCGKQFRVFRRADKTCDNIEPWSIRRMTNTVHLEGLRCEGEGHGGCQAGCLIYWKEAWLKRASKDTVSVQHLQPSGAVATANDARCTAQTLLNASAQTDAQGETVYTCQATEVLRFSSYMWAWDPRQYIRDLRSGNLATGMAGDSWGQQALEKVLSVLRILRSVAIYFFNTRQERARVRRPTYPYTGGTATNVPIEWLDIQPGELVQVRSKEEIIATLNKQDRHRGLLFDGAMLSHCDGIYRVLRRVHRIVDEKTGKMLEMKYPCIALEGVTCQWDYHRLCPRSTCTPYWRENWLKRVENLQAAQAAGQMAETCDKS